MGAWGTGFFENDYAMDWVAELAVAKDWFLVEQAFAAVVADDARADARDCTVALAAAAVVAAAIERAPNELPEAAARWSRQLGKPHAALPGVAAEVIDAILDESELKDSWEETDSFAEWKAALLQLRSGLVAA